MEVPTTYAPTYEAIGKFFGGLLITIIGGWTFLKKIGLIDGKKQEEPMELQPDIKLRRSEDAGIKTALEVMDSRIKAVESRAVEDRNFMLDQIRETEGRLTAQIESARDAADNHNNGINSRLDFIISQIVK